MGRNGHCGLVLGVSPLNQTREMSRVTPHLLGLEPACPPCPQLWLSISLASCRDRVRGGSLRVHDGHGSSRTFCHSYLRLPREIEMTDFAEQTRKLRPRGGKQLV